MSTVSSFPQDAEGKREAGTQKGDEFGWGVV
jgi:hypothetical protein